MGITRFHMGITRFHTGITRLHRGIARLHRGITIIHISAARRRWCRIVDPVHAALEKGLGDRYEINFPHLPRRQIDRCPPRCFLCGEEGHVAANCPACPVLQRLLRQQACASAHDPPQGPIQELPTTKDNSHPGPKVQLNLLEGSSEAKVTPVGCAVGPPITGQLNLEDIPVLGLVDTGASVTCMGFSVWWQYHTQWVP